MSHAPLLPDDPLLPQLPLALDPVHMGEVFARHFSPRAQVLGCTVERIKYRPRRNCSVAWRVELADAQGVRVTQRVAGRFCTGGASLERHRSHVATLQVDTPSGITSFHDAALDLAAWCLPNDPRLAALPVLCGAAPAQLAGHALGTLELVQYVPEQRATARVTAHDAAGRPCTLYVKADRETRGGHTHATMQALAASPQARDGHLKLPASLAWQAQEGLHWQQGVPGSTLLDLPDAASPAMAARVGRLVAALHASEVPLSRRVSAADLRTRLRTAVDQLWFASPRWHAALERIVHALERHLDAIDCAVGVTLHGDLHPRNLLVDGDDLWLIDLDSTQLGAPELDLGSWIADGIERELHGAVRHDRAAAAEAFLEAYRAGSQRHIGRDALRVAVLYQLVCERAMRGLTTLKPGRFERLAELIDQADAMAAQLSWRSAA